MQPCCGGPNGGGIVEGADFGRSEVGLSLGFDHRAVFSRT